MDSLQETHKREPKDSKKKAHRKSSKNVKKVQSKSNLKTSTTASKQIENDKDGIYIISTFQKSFDSNPIENEGPNLNVPFDEEPSTSYKGTSQFIDHVDSDGESVNLNNYEEMNNVSLNAYHNMAQNMIQIMKDSMEHESLYLHYFKKLIELEETMSNIDAVENSNIEQTFRASEDENWSERSVDKLKLKGKKSERNAMRNELLSKLELCYQTKDNIDVVMGELIDYEESLIDS